MASKYEELGYDLVPQFLTTDEVKSIANVVESFHQEWLKDNHSFYQSHAVNSAYLTGTKYLNDEQRLTLFELIGSTKIAALLATLPIFKPAFMNTQLFFDPANPKQKNYWHRDCQYHLDLQQQEQALSGPEVVHFRIALVDEAGIELVPKSHKTWDTQEQLQVRNELDGFSKHNDLSEGQSIPLQQGDLLVFSANMLHRGLYGNDRRALDIIFCESTLELLAFVEKDCLPAPALLARLENGDVLFESLKHIQKHS